MTIDAVIAWVDGADPVHREKRARFRAEAGHGGASEAARFVEHGEIYLCIASILKFAPFVRRLHLVTDAQRPARLGAFAEAGICAPDRIAVVDHGAAFAGLDAAQPTFSSRSIEAVLHRIPGLSERFVYFNDDMLLTAPAAPADFFDGARPVLQGKMLRPARRRLGARAKAALRYLAGRPDTRPGHQAAQELGAALMGYDTRFLRAPHCPHPMRRSTIEAALARHPGLLERQVGFRFRDRAQYWPIALANHAELVLGTPWVPPRPLAYLRDAASAADGLARIRGGAVPAACLQSLAALPTAPRREILSGLAALLASHLPDRVRAEFRTVP